MFVQPSSYFHTDSSSISPTDISSSNQSLSVANAGSELQGDLNPSTHQTSVIVPRHDDSYYSSNVGTPSTPYQPYQFPIIFPTDWTFPFPTPDGNSPISQGLHSPLTNSSFAHLGNSFYNPTSTSRSPFPDFCVTPSHMVQYNSSSGLKKTAGRKPRDQVEMEGEDDDKRYKRRQRNKEAAARCRQRRLDLMHELTNQVNQYKEANENKVREVQIIRKQLNDLQSYMQQHDCKLSLDERRQQLSMISIPPPTVSISSSHLNISMAMPPRAESTSQSIMSNNTSSSSSEQPSPTEDYKPCIDTLKKGLLPPISSMKRPLPPHVLNEALTSIADSSVTSRSSTVTSSSSSSSSSTSSSSSSFSSSSTSTSSLTSSSSSLSTTSVTSLASTSAPLPNFSKVCKVTSSSTSSTVPTRSEVRFLEPELKIPKIEGDRTLTSLASTTAEEVERPSILPMLGSMPINQTITTPSRPFRFGIDGNYQQPTNGNLFDGGVPCDFLSTNTGLTPSGQPAMNFVSAPTPIQNTSSADLQRL